MHRVDEQGRRQGRLGLAILALFAAAIAFSLTLPSFAQADVVALEVEKSGSGAGTVTSAPAGINCEGTCKANFAEGTEVTLTASASPGSEFVYWEGCDSEPEGKCKLTMSEPREVIATFEEAEPAEYTLEITESGNGEGEWECLVGGEEEFCGEEFPQGTHVTIKAAPYEGSKFSGFSGDCSGTTCSLVMDKNHNVTVNFSLKEFTLTIKKKGSGTVVCELEEGPEPCKTKYPWEAAVTLIATPEAGYEFVGWEGCDNKPLPGGTCEIEIEEPRTVTAIFSLKSKLKFKLTVNKAGTGTGTVTSSPSGINCGATCSAEFPEGTAVTLTAVAAPGSWFVEWIGCDSEPIPGQCQVTVGEGKNPTAIFDLISKLTLKVKKEGTGTGTVTSSPSGINCGGACSAEFEEGTEVTLTKSAAAGSEFVSWSGACAGAGSCKVTMSAAKEVTASFILKPTPSFSLVVQREGSGSGSVTSDPAGIECGADCDGDYPEGTVVALTATPAAGSAFKRWSGGVESACELERVCRVRMGAPKAVKAIFESVAPAPAPEALGIARLGRRVAVVRGGRALLEMRCSDAPCLGRLKLIAKLGKRSVVIGKRSFSLTAGSRGTVKVLLSGRAQREVARRGKLKAKVIGGGVLESPVKLKRRGRSR
jgi:hypothetical protein